MDTGDCIGRGRGEEGWWNETAVTQEGGRVSTCFLCEVRSPIISESLVRNSQILSLLSDYLYIYIYVCVCVCVCVCVRLCVSDLYTYVCVCVCVCIYIICICLRVCTG